MFYLDTAKTKEEADQKEKIWIEYYQKEGFPLTVSGLGGKPRDLSMGCRTQC